MKMANPGSPGRPMNMQPEDMPQMPKGTMIGMLLSLGFMLIVMMYRETIGRYLNFVFKYIGFDGMYPVLTLIVAGLIMTTMSSVIRTLMSNPIKMAKSQHIQKEFNREMREARLENNLYKIKKLTEQQPLMMSKTMESSQDQMKIMPITMIIVIPIYAWVFYFISHDVVDRFINVPWAAGVDLTATMVLPSWILIYTLISIPIGQLISKIVRYFLLKRNLAELEKECQAVAE
jgi:uncharacterized membrane protein (DUF106 family)